MTYEHRAHKAPCSIMRKTMTAKGTTSSSPCLNRDPRQRVENSQYCKVSGRNGIPPAGKQELLMKKCVDKGHVDLRLCVLPKAEAVVCDIDSMVDINRLSVEEQSVVEILKDELDKLEDAKDLDNVIVTIERDKVKAKVDGKMRQLASAQRSPPMSGKEIKLK
jgi:hypothetical protein